MEKKVWIILYACEGHVVYRTAKEVRINAKAVKKRWTRWSEAYREVLQLSRQRIRHGNQFFVEDVFGI